MNRADTATADLPRAVWLWFLPLPLLLHVVTGVVDGRGEFFSRWVESESGVIENATALVLIPAMIMALILAWRLRGRFGALATMWFAGVAAVCLGFAGEEISWGQHWWGWSSPEFFAEHNRQGETNLHNLNIHLGRVVKSVLTAAIVVGGLILPFTRRYAARDAVRPRRLADVIVPAKVCVPAAAFVIGVRLIERFKTWFDLDWTVLAVNLKETQELYIALFIVVYVWSVYRRDGRTART